MAEHEQTLLLSRRQVLGQFALSLAGISLAGCQSHRPTPQFYDAAKTDSNGVDWVKNGAEWRRMDDATQPVRVNHYQDADGHRYVLVTGSESFEKAAPDWRTRPHAFPLPKDDLVIWRGNYYVKLPAQ